MLFSSNGRAFDQTFAAKRLARPDLGDKSLVSQRNA